MVGIEYVTDAARHTPDAARAKAMRAEMFARGVMMHTCGGFDNVQRFIGPLTTEDELLEAGLGVYEESLTALERGTPGAVGPSVAATPMVAKRTAAAKRAGP